MAMTPEERKRLMNQRTPTSQTSTPVPAVDKAVNTAFAIPRKAVDTAREVLPKTLAASQTVPRAIGSLATRAAARVSKDAQDRRAAAMDVGMQEKYAEINALKGTPDPSNSMTAGRYDAPRRLASPIQRPSLPANGAQAATSPTGSLFNRIATRAATSGIGSKMAGQQESAMSSSAPLSMRPGANVAGSGAIRIGSTGETATVDANGNLAYFDADGRPISKLTRPANQGLQQRAASAGNGQRIGNLDVQFAPGTSQEEQSAFSRQPVRPTAGIDRYQQRMALDNRQGQLASINAGNIVGKMPPPDSAPGKKVGWKERMTLQQEAMNNQTRLAEAEMNNQAQLQRERMGNDTQLTTAGMTAREAAARTEVDRQQLAAQKPVQDAQVANYQTDTEAKRMTVDQQKQIMAWQQQLTDPETPEEQKVLISKQLTAAGVLKAPDTPKREIATNQEVDERGNVIKTSFVIEPDGTMREVGADGASATVEAPPADPAQRVKNKKYLGANGMPYIWDGQGFILAQQ